MALKFLNNGYFAGKVGIGAESPSVDLQLGNSTLGQTKLAIFNSEGGGEVGLTIQSRTNRAKLRVADNDSNAYVVAEAGKAFFGTSASGDATNVTVLTSGNVGIGTTSPDTKLEVEVNSGAAITRTTMSAADGYRSGFEASNTHTGGSIWSMFSTNNSDGYFGGGKFVIANETMGDVDVNTPALVVVNGAGNVGIGTTSPVSTWLSGFDPSTGNGTFKLTSEGWIVTPYLTGLAGYYPNQGARPIVWADDSGTNLQCWDNSTTDGISLRSSNGTTRLFVKENGNVGIGETNPNSRLIIKNTSANDGIRIHTSDTSEGFVIFRDDSGTSPGAVVYDHSIDMLGFKVNGVSDRMQILSTGQLVLASYSSSGIIGTPTYLLGTDASGNVVKTTTIPGSAAGPYLPLAGGTMTGTNGVIFPDNFNLKIGTGSDLKIFHNATDSFIINEVGNLKITNGANDKDIIFESDDGSGGTTPYLTLDGSITKMIASKDIHFDGTVKATFGSNATPASIYYNGNEDVDTGTETVANVVIAIHTAAFFDFVIKKTTNVRSGTVYACHDGTNVQFTETSTQDLGDTSDVTLSVDISGGNMRLRATTTSDNWSIKSLIRAI